MNTTQANTCPDGAIVVGVGSNGWQSAEEWAVTECRLREAPLHLVHANGIPGTILTHESKTKLVEHAEKLMHDAVTHAHALSDGRLQVSSEIDAVHSPVDSLVRVSTHAQLVVLQHREFGPVRRSFAGSLVNGVAARSEASVVSVTGSWRPRNESGPVTVAIQGPEDAGALLHTAGVAAQARGTDVHVLHACWLDNGIDYWLIDDTFRQQHEGEVRDWLDPAIAHLHETMPDVPVTLTVRHSPPLQGIIDAANDSELLVVGRRHHLMPQGTHLGPVSRAVLDNTDTPVMVIGKAI